VSNKTEKKIEKLLNDYVRNALNLDAFSKQYNKLLSKLEEEIGDIYHPLNVIVPSKNNAEKAWQNNMREMYLQELSNLDALLAQDEPSYSEKLSKQQRIDLCRDALKYIPIASSDREAKEWIEENLISDDDFDFGGVIKKSQMTHYTSLYKTQIVHESFLMSALNGLIAPLNIKYDELISFLCNQLATSRAAWVRCSDCDGFIKIEGASLYSETSNNPDRINWIECTKSQDTQGGDCHLILLDGKREWMLVHSNDFSNFEIRLFGSKKLLGLLNEKFKINGVIKNQFDSTALND